MDYIGYLDEINRFYVAGWVADRENWAASLTIDILVNGEGVGECVADTLRPNLRQLHPESTGRYEFRYYFADPLSMYCEHDVSVRVDGSTYFLIADRSRISPIKGNCDVLAHRPSGPILLSTMGRTGSTAIMAMLAQHPNVVVAGNPPYEVEMGCYYAYALRTLLATGDHEQSLRADEITATANLFHIGFNPYFEASFGKVFKDPLALPHYLSNRLPGRLSAAFRDVILDYYAEVANDQGLQHPIYFAEKSLPERDSRLGIRFMFPNVREVVLVRDLRDVACSSSSSNGLAFDRVVEDLVAAAGQTLAILAERRPSVLLMKYEDFILDKADTVSRLLNFLGLSSITSDEQAMKDLFATHATSVNPTASIGRWKKDLTVDQQSQCEALDPFLDQLGYCV